MHAAVDKLYIVYACSDRPSGNDLLQLPTRARTGGGLVTETESTPPAGDSIIVSLYLALCQNECGPMSVHELLA